MRHYKFVGLAITALSIITPSAFAETTPAPTMNQPDNGFYEGPDPEWATLHASDTRGTVEHRQYHREAVSDHLDWHVQNNSLQGTRAYEDAHRIFHQERNESHRAFHTEPIHPDDGSVTVVPHPRNPSTVVVDPDTQVLPEHIYVGRPSRRSLVASVYERNSARAVQR